MDEKNPESLTRIKLVKFEEISTSELKKNNKKEEKTNFKKVFNIFICICNFFYKILCKLFSCFSKLSLAFQFSICLIPLSIIMIIIIFIIHVYFYNELYSFNFSKILKEEFLDLYVTQIEDFLPELTAQVIKETKLDFENQIFFQVYFKELTNGGFLNNDNSDKKFFQPFYGDENIISLFSSFNNYQGIVNNFTLDESAVKNNLDERNTDQIGELAKIYYYMFPLIWHESLIINSLINQSFFVSYEFEPESKTIINEYLFLRFPKNNDGFNVDNNFVPSHYLLNPLIAYYSEYDHLEDFGEFIGHYSMENWFMYEDNQFRKKIKSDDEHLTKISFAHQNLESDGDINKALVSFSQQYIKKDNRHYIINILFFYNQMSFKPGDNDFSSFIIKNNFSNEVNEIVNETDNTRYSDIYTYVVSVTDSTEYSLGEMDFRFFHLGLYSSKYNYYYMNGIFFDYFNLNAFYDYTENYTTGIKGEYDLNFYVSLYLYKSLFQNIRYSIIKKDREETFLYHFKDKIKVQNICRKINFTLYRTFLQNTEINCWDTINQIYFDEEIYKYITLKNASNSIDPIYPYCSCLPLYCLKNYPELDEELENLEISDKINLPNKCQNKFTSYETKKNNSHYFGDNLILQLIDSSLEEIDYNYIKITMFQIKHLYGYFFLTYTKIDTSGELYIHIFYKLTTKIEIMILILVSLIIVSSISIIIIVNNLKKYSDIISKFKETYELYLFKSENINKPNKNSFTYIKNKKNKKKRKKNIIEEDSLISKNLLDINENNLLDELFSIFCQSYNIGNNDFEKFYLKKKIKSKNQMKFDMMNEKNELFELLISFCLNARFFQLNLNFDYNLYENNDIIKKYCHHTERKFYDDKIRAKLTLNILYELISSECISDYGLITNFSFKYITNINSDSKNNSIQYTMFENIKNKEEIKKEFSEEENESDNKPIKKLVLKRKNILIDMFQSRFESDDFLNYNKLNNAFTFFLINSYYKYIKQIYNDNNSSENI